MKASDLRAKYTAGGNAIIPNSFQCPNYYVDKLMAYLSPEENVVLMFAIRRILGFQENIISRRDKISLSQFTDGIKSLKDGSSLSEGCGMGVQSVRNSLSVLEQYKILIPTTEKPDPVNGQEYWLQYDENQIDMVGLEKRRSEKRAISYERTKKATRASLKKRGVTSDVSLTSDVRGNVGRKAPVTSDVRLGVTSDVNTKPMETHGNPLYNDDLQKIIDAANQEVDAILKANAMSAGRSWTKLPEIYHPWGKAFCGATGLEYIKKNLFLWQGAFEEWMAQGNHPTDVVTAVNEIIAEGKAGRIASPSSITYKMNGAKVNRLALERQAQQKQEANSSEPDWRDAWVQEQYANTNA